MNVEHKTANILLKRGVQVPVTAPLFLRIFGKKTVSFSIQALSMQALLLIALRYTKMNLKDAESISLTEAFELLKTHHKAMSEIIAIAILDGRYNFLVKPLARWLRRISTHEISVLFQLIIVYGGVEDFINTIRLTGATRITMPMNLSPKEKTS